MVVYESDFATEDIVIVCTARIPCRLATPRRDANEFRRERDGIEWVFFPSDYESDLIRSICLKRESEIFAERTGYLRSEREAREGSIAGYKPDSRSGIRETDTDEWSLGECLCRTWRIRCRSHFDGLYVYVGIFPIGESFGNRIRESGTLDE